MLAKDKENFYNYLEANKEAKNRAEVKADNET